MKRKFMAALLGFLFLCMILLLLPAKAEEYNTERKLTMEEAITYANQEIGYTYYATPAQAKINGRYQTMGLNLTLWDNRQILVYGDHTSVPTSEQDKDSKGTYRYFGYTINGDLLPDPNFKEDHPSTTLINNYLWRTDPWRPEKGGTGQDVGDDSPDYDQYIKAGLLEKYKTKPSLYDNSLQPKTDPSGQRVDWHTVTKILQPRTSVTPGLARMWHNWNGAWWYITIIIPNVLPPDLEVTALSNLNPVNTKTKQTATANYCNNSAQSQTFEAIFYVGDKAISTENITLAAGQDITKSYVWTAPETAGKVILKAEAKPVPNEADLTNNTKILTVDVKKQLTTIEPKCLPCTEKPSITNTWEELYEWQVYHPETSSGTDEKGNPYDYDSSWWEDLSEVVTYKETMSTILSVNTKQGIAAGGRESRGAWEIIPYASKNRLDPNEVTRSGYGFEVKLVSTYSNDWEDKVPSGADPHGGSFEGPDKAVADFYDTKGRFVKRVNMVPTNGKAGDKNITWELPSQRYIFQDGTTIYERKHYVDINVPDGKYQVKVTVSGAGKTELCLIQKKYITIYKDAYEDIYTRVATEDE